MKTFAIIIGSLILGLGVRAKTIYVDDDNISGTEDGTLQHPFNTITEAIIQAVAEDSVYIFNGSYSEGIYLYLKDGLIIIGEDSAAVKIYSTINNPDSTMSYYTEVTNLTCEGFYFAMGSGRATILIKQCHFKDVGFSSGAGYTFIVENCTIENEVGNASGACYLYVRHNNILNGKIIDRGGTPDTVETHIFAYNKISNDGFSDPSEAVIEGSSASISLLYNEIICKDTGSAIAVSTGPPTNIIGNTITLNNGVPIEGTFGIITSSGYGVVTDNVIKGGWVGYDSRSGAVLFARNTITQAHYGFLSAGAEAVVDNTIKNCYGHGMVMRGLRGPITGNTIIDNDSAGILLIHNVDMGGGNWHGAGGNTIQNNGYYDLVIPFIPQEPETVYVQNNLWDHKTIADILKYDIYNAGGSPNIVVDLSGVITSIPAPPVLISPPNATNDINPYTFFKWHRPSGGASMYELQISSENNFSNLLIDTFGISDTTFRASLDVNKMHYWRIKAWNPLGYSEWSETWNFKTAATSIDNHSPNDPWLLLFPNPTSGSLTINLHQASATTLNIFNAQGRLVYSDNLSKNIISKTLDISVWPAGIYFIEIQSKEDRSVKKLIISK